MGAVTSTTPEGKFEPKKDIMAIMAAHRIPYAATMSVAHTDDIVRKIKLARGIRGFRFFLIHSPCPTGWKSDPEKSVELVRLAVDTGIFPLYEVFDGRRYRINQRPVGTDVESYCSLQGRFTKGTLNLDSLRQLVSETWEDLDRRAEFFPARKDE